MAFENSRTTDSPDEATPLYIRRAAKEDAAEIGYIHVGAIRNAYAGIYTPEYLASLSADERAARWTEEGKGHLGNTDPTVAVFVAFSNGKLVGFADVGPEEPASLECAELFAIYLDPAYIGRGVGRALFNTCVEHAKAHGFKSMTAHVLSRNSLARAFYERMQGEPMPATERLIKTGGTTENVISYCWAALPGSSSHHDV
jgi:GNAT superfamily N-acetyltransferase